MSKNAAIAKESVQYIIAGLDKKIKNLKLVIERKAVKIEKKTNNKSWSDKQIEKKMADLHKDGAKLEELEASRDLYLIALQNGTAEELLEKNNTAYGKFATVGRIDPDPEDVVVEPEEVHEEPKPEAPKEEPKPEEVKEEAPKPEVDMHPSKETIYPMSKEDKVIIEKYVAVMYNRVECVERFDENGMGTIRDVGNPERAKLIIDNYYAFKDVVDFVMIGDGKYAKAFVGYLTRHIQSLDVDHFDKQFAYKVTVDGVHDERYVEFMDKMGKFITADYAETYDFVSQNMFVAMYELNDVEKINAAYDNFIIEAVVPSTKRLITPETHTLLSNGAWLDYKHDPMDEANIRAKGGKDSDVAITKRYAAWLGRYKDKMPEILKRIQEEKNKVA